MTKDEEIAMLRAQNAELLQRVAHLEEKVLQLLQIIEKQGIKKDSRNSHNSPSQDKSKPKRNQSLRSKSNRKTGGQPGHKGHTLKMTDNPDVTEVLRSDFCTQCGTDLREEVHSFIKSRQEIVIPPIVPQVIEYQQFGCICSCGHHQKADFPQGVNAPIQFGSGIVALVAYFNVYQYIPFQRLRSLFGDVFNLSMSEGSIDNLLKKGARQSQVFYNAIADNIKNAQYVGSDETGAKVKGSKFWIWVWQNTKNTFLKISKSRGFDTVAAAFPEGLPNAIIGSDRWAAQLKIKSKAKQLCLPHLMRDLNYLQDLEKHEWAGKFKDLLQSALALKQISLRDNKAYKRGQSEAQLLEDELNELLAFPVVKEQYEVTAKFQQQMLKNRNHLLTFLYHLDVPPDNNASERAVRNVKVKQKISGQFKSGQDAFCILRSLIDTFRKRRLNILQKLNIVMGHSIPE